MTAAAIKAAYQNSLSCLLPPPCPPVTGVVRDVWWLVGLLPIDRLRGSALQVGPVRILCPDRHQPGRREQCSVVPCSLPRLENPRRSWSQNQSSISRLENPQRALSQNQSPIPRLEYPGGSLSQNQSSIPGLRTHNGPGPRTKARYPG